MTEFSGALNIRRINELLRCYCETSNSSLGSVTLTRDSENLNLHAKSSLALLLLLVVLVGGFAGTVNSVNVIPINVSVSPSSVPAGQPFMVVFFIAHGVSASFTANVYVRSCDTCSNIWSVTGFKFSPGLDYEVYPDAISTPGNYVVDVEAVGEPGDLPAAGEASFIVGSGPPFDFGIKLMPAGVSVNPGETATFQVILEYSDPSYSGTSIDAQVSGLGPGMDYQLIPSPPTLQVSTSSTTPPGNYMILLTGSANGVVHQADALIHVQAVQPFDFSITASPTQQSITPGSGTTSTVTVAPLSGTPQSVALTVSGAPNGVSATLNPASGTPEFSSTLSITTTASVAPGQYALTVTGTAGTTSHQTAFTLTIEQPPDFRIDGNPPSQTTTQGGTATYQISVVSLNGFNSPVTLTVSELPPGANGVFTVTSGTPDFASVLTVTLPANVPNGTFTLAVTGTGGGMNRYSNLVLLVNQTASTSSQTSTQTSSPPSSDLMGMLQQNGLLILAAAILLVGAALVVSRRRQPSVSGHAAQGSRSGGVYCRSCGSQDLAGNKFCASCGAEL